MKRKNGPPPAFFEYLQIRERISIQPSVDLLENKHRVAPLYALDVVNGFIQFVVSHKNCPDPKVPYVLLSGPIHTFYESVRNEPFFTELSTLLGLKWGDQSLTGLVPVAFDTNTLTEQMLLQLQRDYGKQLSRSLQSWVYKGERIPHKPTALIWSAGVHNTITETVRVSGAATQITAAA